MQRSSTTETRRSLLLSITILGLLAALFILPYQFKSEAVVKNKNKKRGLVTRTSLEDTTLENYDIRLHKTKETVKAMQKFRNDSSKTAYAIADTRDNFVKGEKNLRTRVKTLKVEYNQDLRIPEVISPDVWKKDLEILGQATSDKRSTTLRNFVKRNNQLFGMNRSQIDNLKVLADYMNPTGNMGFAHLEQRINGIPVFRGEVKAGFRPDGSIIRVINNLAPDLDYNSLSKDFGNPLDAVKSAAKNINYKLQRPDVTRNDATSTDIKTVFGEGMRATTAEKMYFPTEVGVARAAWRVLIWIPNQTAYYVIVDAETGTMLWRKNIAEEQTQSAKFDVYVNPNAFMNVAESPFPGTPGPIDPGTADAATNLGRTTLTLIGNEGNLSFNNNGWITDGGDRTDGNAVQAGLDISGPDGIDTDGEAIEVNAGQRDFQFNFSPFNPNDGTGDGPTGADYRNGAVTQLFYIINRYHDAMYMLGFTEQAFNFQQDNFGRGGAGGDRVSAESQDSSGTNNARFFTPSDGNRGAMEMFVWDLEGPGLSGSLDGDIVIHEFTHGLSNRLHGNSSGLTSNMPRMMGEGWSDFYSHALLSQESDPANGIYTLSGWATSGLLGPLSSYYYGIRRFPKAPMAFTGGPNNRPHNPITFADIDDTTDDYSDGAFPAPVSGHLSNTADQVHTGGEVWSAALWEVRTLMVSRLGFANGNQKALQVVTDGMKLSPLNPDYIQARDAIIAAAAALPLAPVAQADVDDVREGFRIRGMGFSAKVITAGTGGGTARVMEAFDVPNARLTDPFGVNDASGNNSGFPDPGESVMLSVPVENSTGATVNNVFANVNGGTNVAYGNISDGQTVTMQIPYTIPGGEQCGSNHQVTINVTSDIGARPAENRSFTLGEPSGTTENFDGSAAPTLPTDWTSSTNGDGTGWAARTDNPSSGANSLFAEDIGTVGESFLETPEVPIASNAALLKFKMHHDVENSSFNPATAFDGVVLDIKIGAGSYQDIIAAGGSFVMNGYNSTVSTSFSNPVGGRMAWSGDSQGYIDVEIMLPAAANGENVQLRWNMATDSSVTDVGVDIDDVQIISSFNCQAAGSKARADFDGDGRTDLSIFRPSEGNWYINGSTDGFGVINFGIATDTLVPGDYDGDGKADTAVFRPDDNEANSDFFILNSNGFTISGFSWGVTGDIPVVGDYDGDGKDDISVWRGSDSTWYTINSSDGTNTIEPFGLSGDVPIVMDNDGDGKANLTVFRPSENTWYIARSTGTPSTNFDAIPFGTAGDILVPGDYDGDGKDDVSIFRPSEGNWYVLNSGDSSTSITLFGTNGDIPVPGDYDGDGKEDFAIFRSSGDWWVNGTTSGLSVSNFGLNTDIPIPSKATP